MTATGRRRKRILTEIADERDRQVKSERWSARHDDSHVSGSLAAAGYALEHTDWREPRGTGRDPGTWPWADGWKPKGARENLVRAAALLVAEIERLDRAGARQ